MKIAICGYGNIGRGVECAIRQNPDMELTGIYTRRAPETVKTLTGAPVYAASEIEAHAGEIDAVIICGGSATDLPVMTPMLAEKFNVVDSFDTHATIPEHFARTDSAAAHGKKIAVISGGWDPGMFSLNRLYASVILPDGKDYTFWGRGVSQGHSDAIRRIPGVKDARQYTVPVPAAVELARSGADADLTPRQKHTRECFVVAEDGADKERIREQIVTMPHYFDEYDTSVTFITEEEMKRDHSGLPHGGMVIRNGRTGLNGEHRHTIEYKLELESNPEFTSGVLVALARAAVRLNKRGESGCRTIFDIAPADLSALSPEELRAHLL